MKNVSTSLIELMYLESNMLTRGFSYLITKLLSNLGLKDSNQHHHNRYNPGHHKSGEAPVLPTTS